MNLQGTGEELSAELKSFYESWLQQQMKKGKGDAKRRLSSHGHAEKMFLDRVWWPAFRTLEGLHPEYEVKDFKDGTRFLDFAYLAQGMKVCIEIDGYGPHWRDVDRRKFADNLMRQNHLVIDGWLVLRFSYDDIMERPRSCQQVLQQLLGKMSMVGSVQELTLTELAIISLARRHLKPITTKLVAEELGIHRDTALQYIRALVAKKILQPIRPDAKHVRGYRINGFSEYFR